LGLSQHLSPMRTNGLFSMVERIKAIGKSFL
jgi:sulfur transfer protein SufE